MANKTFDIRPRSKSKKSVSPELGTPAAGRRRKKKAEETEPKQEIISETIVLEEKLSPQEATRDAFLEYVAQSPNGNKPFSVPVKQSSKLSRFLLKIIKATVLVGLIASLVYGAGVVLARVNIKMTVSREVQEEVFPIRLVPVNPKAATTSGLFYEETKKTFSYTQSYQATGSGEATGYAQGKIRIENSYSAQTMRFVAGTRFNDSRGLVFRTQEAITIPGYTKSQDKIIPGTVLATVKADTAGSSGNLTKDTVLKVVVYKGTDKYDSLIGVVENDFQGGVQGKVAVVSADDIQNAKQQIVEYAFSRAKDEVLESLPEGTQVLDRAMQLKINKVSVKAAVGDTLTQFEAITEGELKIRFFDERQIRQFLEEKMEQPAIKNEIVQSELQLAYENVSSSFETKEMSMQIRAKRVVSPVLDILAFKQRIAGKAINELKAELLKLEGIEKVEISVWPFWLSRVPVDLGRIKIALD